MAGSGEEAPTGSDRDDGDGNNAGRKRMPASGGRGDGGAGVRSAKVGSAARSNDANNVSARAPRHKARATRSAGLRMRSRLLDAASTLFRANGLNGTSLGAIAADADAFPSQVTYYFRSKEALFVEAACRDMLHVAERAEQAAARARTPSAYTAALVASVCGTEGLALFVEALILARQRPDLLPQVARTVERLHVEGARAYAGEMARHCWRSHQPADVSARKFWTIALGTALEGHATGRSATAMAASMREMLGELADSPATPARPALQLVTAAANPVPRTRRGPP